VLLIVCLLSCTFTLVTYCTHSTLIDVLNEVQYRRITLVLVSVSAETENVVSAAVSVMAVTGKVVSVGL